MKKYMSVFSVAICLFMLFAVVGNVYAVKPEGTGSITVPWNLTSAVMPVPPYGAGDIPGSDTASKLIVNQPNGNTEVTITGVMKGLAPNTTYEVRLNNSYVPYVFTGWDVSGNYTIYLSVGTTPYTEYVALAQSGNSITGTSLALAGNASLWIIDSGSVAGTQVTFLAHYATSPGLQATFSAEIASDGSLINGTWHDVAGGTRSGLWHSTSGAAIKSHTGDTWSPGFFTGTIPMFTFTTDELGAGSWHINITEQNYSGSGAKNLSVWINAPGRSILVSDVFSVVFD